MIDLEKAVEEANKEFGEGSVMSMEDKSTVNVDVISSGSISLNEALGVGGFPRGRIIEIFGPEASGKTSVCLHLIAEAQKTDLPVIFIDAEHSLDKKWAQTLGVDTAKILISQPNSGEEALSIAEHFTRHGCPLIIIDSVAALVPKAELEGEMGDAQMGLQARLMSQAMRKLAAIVQKNNTCLVFTNQLREKIGIMFGNPETTTGGRALKFYSSIRLDVRRTGPIKESDKITGHTLRLKVVKNKVAAPFNEANVELIYGLGIDLTGDIINYAVGKEIIQKSGTWFSYKDEKLGQGKRNARTYLSENPEVLKQITEECTNPKKTKGSPK